VCRAAGRSRLRAAGRGQASARRVVASHAVCGMRPHHARTAAPLLQASCPPTSDASSSMASTWTWLTSHRASSPQAGRPWAAKVGASLHVARAPVKRRALAGQPGPSHAQPPSHASKGTAPCTPAHQHAGQRRGGGGQGPASPARVAHLPHKTCAVSPARRPRPSPRLPPPTHTHPTPRAPCSPVPQPLDRAHAVLGDLSPGGSQGAQAPVTQPSQTGSVHAPPNTAGRAPSPAAPPPSLLHACRCTICAARGATVPPSWARAWLWRTMGSRITR
jgi:hypothetical protein